MGNTQMTEFETKLLRLVALGIVTFGCVGLVIAEPRVPGPFAAIAMICMLFIAGGLLFEFARAMWARFEERWMKEWRDILARPPRAQRDPDHSP